MEIATTITFLCSLFPPCFAINSGRHRKLHAIKITTRPSCGHRAMTSRRHRAIDLAICDCYLARERSVSTDGATDICQQSCQRACQPHVTLGCASTRQTCEAERGDQGVIIRLVWEAAAAAEEAYNCLFLCYCFTGVENVYFLVVLLHACPVIGFRAIWGETTVSSCKLRVNLVDFHNT